MLGNKQTNIFIYISKFVVDKKNLFFLIFILSLIFCVFGLSLTVVENDITAYLGEDTTTREGLEVMNEEFITYGSAQVMVSNVTYQTASEISDEISKIEGVSSVTFANNQSHYKDASALISVSFKGTPLDEISVSAVKEIRKLADKYDSSIKTDVGVSYVENLAQEMLLILILSLVIILAVLLFTSKSYAEILILLITFAAAALLNMGTNFIFGKISFVSNSVAVILQLALAIDYAVILCHRFLEERERYEAREAAIYALSKAIPEVFSSSLTTLSGLFALSFMDFKLGADLSMVLIKSIICSLVCVFFLMPGLLVVSSKLIDKTRHKNYLPSIYKLGKMSLKLRYIIFPLFAIVAVSSCYLSNQTQYTFTESGAQAIRRSEIQLEGDRISQTFPEQNMLAVIVPSIDYEKEAKLINELEKYEEVESIIGLANTEALDGYMLTSKLTARQFSELLDLDYEMAQLVYAMYAVNDENYAKLIGGSENYSLPLVDLVMFVDDLVREGYIDLDEELADELSGQAKLMRDGKSQLESDKYSRILLFFNLPTEGEETFAFLETVKAKTSEYYDEVYLVGNSTNSYDLSAVFDRDYIIISVLSALFVMVVLLFTFRSAGTPILLIIIIQTAIFINFSFPYLQNTKLFFIGYLVVSAIQMGANVDYAIVITNRYMKLKQKYQAREAIIKAVDESFVTVITSGTILATAGIILQFVTTDGTIAVLGECIGRGTIISMILVLFVLPSLLYAGTGVMDSTSFSIKVASRRKKVKGKLKTNAYVKGYFSGYIDAKVEGTMIGKGEIEANFESQEIENKEDEVTL